MPRGADGKYYQDWSRHVPGLDDSLREQDWSLLSDPEAVRGLLEMVKKRRQRLEQWLSQAAATYSVTPDQALHTCIDALIQGGDNECRGLMMQRVVANVDGQPFELP